MSTPLPTLKKNPLPCSSGYTIDAYCQYENPEHGYRKDTEAGADTFFGQSKGQALQAARKAGWFISQTWMATCPLCNKAFDDARKKSRMAEIMRNSAKIVAEETAKEKKNQRRVDPNFHMGKKK